MYCFRERERADRDDRKTEILEKEVQEDTVTEQRKHTSDKRQGKKTVDQVFNVNVIGESSLCGAAVAVPSRRSALPGEQTQVFRTEHLPQVNLIRLYFRKESCDFFRDVFK